MVRIQGLLDSEISSYITNFKLDSKSKREPPLQPLPVNKNAQLQKRAAPTRPL